MFEAGDYLRRSGQAAAEPLFLDTVPIRFGMADDAHYHVPAAAVAPWHGDLPGILRASTGRGGAIT